MEKKEKNTKKVHTKVCGTAAAVTIFILEAYSLLETSVLVLPNVSGLILNVLRVLFFVLHTAFFTGCYMLFYRIFLRVKRAKWEKKNSKFCIAGTWLHIHDKSNVKIGVVEIEQDFFDLSVFGENIKPQCGYGEITKWHYIGSEFNPNGNAQIRLMGCYVAQRDNVVKKGVHSFTSFTSRENNVIYKMTGEFGDALSVEDNKGNTAISDKTGKVFLFRMTDALKKYINYKSLEDYTRERLQWIMNETNPEIAETEYVKALKEIYYRNEFQDRLKELEKFYTEQNLEPQLETVKSIVTDVILYAMSVDGKVDRKEFATLEKLTGLSNDYSVYQVPEKEKILSDVRTAIKSISHDKTLDLFKLIISHSCRSIITCNLDETPSEQQFLDEIESVFKENVVGRI